MVADACKGPTNGTISIGDPPIYIDPVFSHLVSIGTLPIVEVALVAPW